MRFRKLRIAWSVAWGIVACCCGVVGAELSVMDGFNSPTWGTHFWGVQSIRGKLNIYMGPTSHLPIGKAGFS